MALDVYFDDNLENIITSHVYLALKVASVSGRVNAEYIQGILDLAHCHALSLGLDWKGMVKKLRASANVDIQPLLKDIFVNEIFS